MIRCLFVILTVIWLSGCDDKPLNSPYPLEKVNANILFSSFTERPKTLDPAIAYSSNEYTFLYQIYEPPLQYHYLLRPYTLTEQTAERLPEVTYFDTHDKPVDETSSDIAYTLYTITIKPNIYYQPHPAFAILKDGTYRYHQLSPDFLDDNDINVLSDFTYTGTRKLKAQDYVYQIKRLASPKINSPIFGLMSQYISGLREYAKILKGEYQKKTHVDLRAFDISGVKALDDRRYQIKIKGKYPQFEYWLAMPFFAPLPWEAEAFYEQPGMLDRNITLAWYPIGTGPYMLSENNPNRRMLLIKNPNYHFMTYPSSGTEQDKEEGLLKFAGQRLPFVDKILFSLEKESIPRWNKFLQGYYDSSGVSADSFDGAIKITKDGKAVLTSKMQKKKVQLKSAVEPSIFYMGFNMLDKVVGGESERSRKLRLAISIAINYEEYIAIFLNGRGLLAQGPIPPGISGYEAGERGINPYVYQWKEGRAERLPLQTAKRLLYEAGYPNGRDKKTGEQLILNYDAPGGQGPEQKAHFAWLRKEFEKLGISLNVRATQYNRFQQKMRTGQAQLFTWGWHADYPDPENFLFLLLGSNGKVKYSGENASNYDSPEYNRLYEEMKNTPKGEQRLKIIKKMVALLQHDAPWVWGYYPKTLLLSQDWVSKTKLNTIGNNTLKYIKVDPILRTQLQRVWNKPVFWPIFLVLGLILLFLFPVFIAFYVREHKLRQRVPR